MRGGGLSIHCMQSHLDIFLAESGDVSRRHGTKFNEGISTINGPGSSVGIVTATGWTVRGANSGGGEIFRTCPDRS